MKRSRWIGVLTGAAVAAALGGAPLGAAPSGAAPTHQRAAGPGVSAALAPAGPVTVGRVTPAGSSMCSDDTLWMQTQAAPGQPSSTVPFAGVVTALHHFANANPHAQIQAVFMRPTAGAYDVAHRSPVVTITPGQLNVIPERISVQAGEILALRPVSGGPRCTEGGAPTDLEDIGSLSDSETSWTPIVVNGSMQIVNLSAVLEPDADGDGYGDVSQDGCPQLSAFHGSCPAPVTKIGKAPKKRTTAPKVRITFSSSIAGSTFGCSIDGRAFKPCHSPFKRRFPVGTHTVRVQATSPEGVTGAPVTVQFKIVKPKR